MPSPGATAPRSFRRFCVCALTGASNRALTPAMATIVRGSIHDISRLLGWTARPLRRVIARPDFDGHALAWHFSLSHSASLEHSLEVFRSRTRDTRLPIGAAAAKMDAAHLAQHLRLDQRC